MNFFSKFFPKKKNTLEDFAFGKIEYENGIWTNIPDGSKTQFMITIYASELGPSKAQQELFQIIMHDLDAYKKKAKDFMASYASKATTTTQLEIYSIDIGDEEETKNNSFTIELSDELANEIHRIQFKNKKAIHYGVDD